MSHLFAAAVLAMTPFLSDCETVVWPDMGESDESLMSNKLTLLIVVPRSSDCSTFILALRGCLTSRLSHTHEAAARYAHGFHSRHSRCR